MMYARDKTMGSLIGKYIAATRKNNPETAASAINEIRKISPLVSEGLLADVRIARLIMVKNFEDGQVVETITDKRADSSKRVAAIKRAMQLEWNDAAGMLAMPCLTDYGAVLIGIIGALNIDEKENTEVRAAALEAYQQMRKYLELPKIPWPTDR